MFTREQQLEYCRTCQLRKFSNQKGIICSLTDEKADFIYECADYKRDEIAYKDWEREKEQRKKDELADKTVGLSVIGLKNSFQAGLLILIVAFIAELGYVMGGVGIPFAGWIILFLYLLGLALTIKGIIHFFKRLINRKKAPGDLIDTK